MTSVHKKHEAKPEEIKTASSAKGSGEPKEPVVISDVVTKTTENIEVVDDVPASRASSADALSDFKEKMIKEESLGSGNTPKKNYMWPIFFIFIIAIALFVGIFIYKQGIFKGEKINVATSSPTPTITPEPTKTIDFTKYEIEILNGSGVDGEAGRQKTNLEAEGFTVSSVGNADNSDYTDTIIKAKKAVDKDFLNKLKTVLENSFTVKEEELPVDALVPVTIILGQKI
ncbi:MAG: hypothetical protein A3B47_03240 [Candidatus Levybacteria bacterium RIFCSPLOWO2_01_FULL_39_24]|nr:MAG: hypothetical protein A2800_02530 [Candidatus Levybacteria bacterium RIFCSPHIGHO2_01_FULL_40_16]OGH28199.1 MAG: hypothetical protein A3E12_00500 [Candidatus Levybacteria bacterium RIFCSPHIGHO2_12_FULL_39_9]OGH46634.1 MAG: hypothetical protein A3B47_03240 [Candidatus Levybacteria bacterium RIFCSPLOWO2_01_FULL_39_24]